MGTGGAAPGRLPRLSAVVRVLLAAESVEAVAEAVTGELCEAAGATIGSISLLVDDQTLATVGVRGVGLDTATHWATYPLSGDNPAAEAVRTAQPVVLLDDLEIARRYPDLEWAAPGERAVVCLPMLASGGRRLGVVALSFPGRLSVAETELLFLRLLVDTCAMSIDRVQAREAAADREAKLAMLAATGEAMASSLDYSATLVTVAQSAVPWFADWCTIALAEDGRLHPIANAHARPDLMAVVQDFQARFQPQPDAPSGPYQVLRTGLSDLVPELTDEMLEASAQDEEQLRLMKLLGLRSALSCPLTVGDRVIGVITWVSGDSGRRFTAADQVFGESLAQRAAAAIDNAQLHSQVRDVAAELRDAVLPGHLPELPGWSLTVRHLTAGRGGAGGDFYDAVPLANGRLAAFVGDVMGRGVQAASTMAQMRAAIRTLIAVDPAPAAVLAGLDRVFDTLHLEQLVTMVYALADPDLDHLALISAGHPQPLLLRANGDIEVLDQDSTLVLGVGGGHRSVLRTDLGPGDGLLLYTDGLVERRGEDTDDGLARLRSHLLAHPVAAADPTSWLVRLVDDVRDPTRDDDVAALLLRRTDY